MHTLWQTNRDQSSTTLYPGIVRLGIFEAFFAYVLWFKTKSMLQVVVLRLPKRLETGSVGYLGDMPRYTYNRHQVPSLNPSTGRKVALYAIFRLSAIQ